jgi:8-oxo-dGTP pyrophosphatase MutT (NUDIX family)
MREFKEETGIDIKVEEFKSSNFKPDLLKQKLVEFVSQPIILWGSAI